MTSISNPVSGAQNTPFPTSTFNGVFQVAGGEQATETAEASVSLNANLSGVQAATGTGELALEFAQAIKSATEVDPATGHREIVAGAGAQLTSTINSLLVENGFSAEQASTLSANVATQLTQGGPITLSAAFDNTSQVSQVSISSYAAGGISLASSVAATEQSGSIAIGINLDTGEVNVAVQEQTSATYEAYGNLTTTTDPLSSAVNLLSSTVGALTSESGAAGLGNSDFGQLLDSPSNSGSGSAASAAASASGNSPLSESEVDTFALTAIALVAGTLSTPSNGASGSQAPSQNTPTDSTASTPQDGTSNNPSSTSSPSNSDSTDAGLQSLISSLNNTRLVSQQELSTLLQSLAKIAAQAQAAANTAEHKAAAGGNTNDGASNAAAPAGIHAGATNDFEIQFGFTQTTSIQLLDLNGYGSTLYKRPDGSLGKITTQPVHESA